MARILYGGERAVRKRRWPRLGSVPALLGLAWLGFFIHACAAGPVYRDPASPATISAAPRIEVGLSKSLRVERAQFSVRGAYSIATDRGVAVAGESLEALVTIDRQIRINDRSFGDAVVRVSCARDGDLEIGGVRYHGSLLVVADEDRQTRAPRITLVNEVDLEQYLKGVVGREMSLSAGVEALKAQVVAARTYAMFEARNKTLRTLKGERFDVYDDERSQVYGGMERETSVAVDLVEQTRGMFVVWNGRLFKTFFSSTCGGHTEPARPIMGSEAEDIPPLGGTACPWCEGTKHYRWTETFVKSELSKKLFPDRPTARINSIRITKALPGGHAQEIAVSLDGATREVLLHANDGFRRKVDPRKIKSTLWEKIEDRGATIALTGRGWGHGVGLCQVGAYKMAGAGKTANEILEFYYPSARVQKLY